MKIVVILAALIVLAAGVFTAYSYNTESKMSTEPLKEKSIYEFVMKDIDGNDVKMDKYKGKVLLLVNVASECGFTPQYQGLQKIYEKYKGQDFYVLGFPANNFGGQEPGSNEQIKEFCSARFRVTFPMFGKISVKGSDKHPLFRYLTEEATNPGFAGDLNWNFNKFLVDKNGKVVARFGSGDTPEGDKVTGAIEAAIK